MGYQASIDIGTNSTRLLLADCTADGKVRAIEMKEQITRLGEGAVMDQVLRPDGMRRVVQALQGYRAYLDQWPVEQIVVFATSATREARNRDEFLDLIKQQTGWPCQVLSGEREAELAFRGAVSDVVSGKPLLVVDIGGGSTELVSGSHASIERRVSLDIGSRRLLERFDARVQYTPDVVARMQDYIQAQLNPCFPDNDLSRYDCISVGGTATTLAMIDAAVPLQQAARIHHYVFSLPRLRLCLERLTALSLAARREVTGLHPERADVIVAGGLILQQILSHFNINQTTISLRDAMVGILSASASQ